ncbi:MAG: Bax inhibitor-1/YccA family protein, partial [Lachnospiraceae bacterium]|nr:Bax inhibitor-1/YccA family protein [Lachnospiraceae bacterium]
MAPAEAIIMIVVLAISLIVPFLAWFIRASVPVTGTIYCVAQGYLIGFITVALAQEYKFISFLAMIITLALVAAMLFVYAKRIIKVTARFRGIITAIFIGIVLSGIIFFILSIIPGIRNSMAYQGVASVMNNPAFSIILSIVFVIIAALFMLVDFDTIERCVENKMDKKYEWMAAWGLAYTILYIYFKVLRILLMIFGRGKSSRD